MTVDREQTRRDDFQTVQEAVASIQASLAPGALKRSRDALDALQRILAELEQAERERDEKEALAANYRGMWAGQRNRANAAEARLVLADTLAEAGKRLDAIYEGYRTSSEDDLTELWSDDALIEALYALRLALAAYEQEQKP